MEEAGQQKQHGARHTTDGEEHVVVNVVAATVAVEEKQQVIEIAAAIPTTETAVARALGNKKVSERAGALSKQLEADAGEARSLSKRSEAVAARARALGNQILCEQAEAEAAWVRALGKQFEAEAAVTRALSKKAEEEEKEMAEAKKMVDFSGRCLLLLLVFTCAFLLWLWFDLMKCHC